MRAEWLEPVEYENPECPICGEECEKLYRVDVSDEIIGCDKCIVTVDAYEWMEEEKEERRYEYEEE